MGYTERLPSTAELNRLRAAWPGRGWTWDPRYECVVSSFSASSEADYQEIIAATFPVRFTRRTISKAPASLQRLLEDMDGVRDGQLVYAPKDCRDDFACVLWWPWGDDVNISVRVTLSDDSEPVLSSFRELFNVEL